MDQPGVLYLLLLNIDQYALADPFFIGQLVNSSHHAAWHVFERVGVIERLEVYSVVRSTFRATLACAQASVNAGEGLFLQIVADADCPVLESARYQRNHDWKVIVDRLDDELFPILETVDLFILSHVACTKILIKYGGVANWCGSTTAKHAGVGYPKASEFWCEVLQSLLVFLYHLFMKLGFCMQCTCYMFKHVSHSTGATRGA